MRVNLITYSREYKCRYLYSKRCIFAGLAAWVLLFMGYYYHETEITARISHYNSAYVYTLVAEGAELNAPAGVKKWLLQLLVEVHNLGGITI